MVEFSVVVNLQKEKNESEEVDNCKTLVKCEDLDDRPVLNELLCKECVC